MECPCKNCTPPKRKIGCHKYCEEYKRWRSYKDQENKEKNDKKFIERNLYHKIW